MASAQEIANALGASLVAALKPFLEQQSKVIDALSQQKNAAHSMVDARGMGRPPSFDGADKAWREWKGKMIAYLYATVPDGKPVLDWAESHPTTIMLTAMEDYATHKHGARDQKL